ncbi:MAG: class I SAM-dependent methyltransferase [Deltaproteobacteria bacterium]|nr:class I SAM-dependent methyltransferase [Deltaproteobacteria bacterium]
MGARRDAYVERALPHVSRLLGLQDRNPYSPTYGCFHRDYWLDKTSDFPDAVRQFGVHALALAWACDFPGNPYRGQPKVRDWTVAGLEFWARIQHDDGSFDEFYPFERGWSGPTAFTTYTAIEACRLLGDELPREARERVHRAIHRAARFIARGESEEDHLANHHAIACMTVWKACEMLGDPELERGFHRLWDGFLKYYVREEGWTIEYDGVDPGYLSATVSFLGKLVQSRPDPEVLALLERLVEFCAWFVYPDGSYAGLLGSRNTLHFYPHGFEILAPRIPLAAAVAEKTLGALDDGKLVPPEIMGDRYVFYRVPELLQSWLDWTPRPEPLPPLPCERPSFTRWFPRARVFVAANDRHYVVANLAKGGALRAFDRRENRPLLNDGGLLGRLVDGRVVSSQWVDPEHRCTADDRGFEVSGTLHAVPTGKLFSPLKTIVFRSALLGLGWNPRLAHWMKGGIRRSLMLGRRPVPLAFRRRFTLHGDGGATIEDEVRRTGDVRVADLSVGDEFYVRYVPQSRYFQPHELVGGPHVFGPTELAELNGGGTLRCRRMLDAEGCAATAAVAGDGAAGDVAHDVQRTYWESGRARRRPDDALIASFVEPKLAWLRERIELPAGARILDAGCGNGYFTWYLERLGTTVGVDYARAMLRAHPGRTLAQASAARLPFADRSFDLVFCSNLLHHVDDPVEVVAEMGRVSRGWVVLHEPNRNNPAMLALGLVKAEERRSLRFTKGHLERTAQLAGLEVVDCATLGFVTPNRMPRPVAELLGRWNAPHPLAAFTLLAGRRADAAGR